MNLFTRTFAHAGQRGQHAVHTVKYTETQSYFSSTTKDYPSAIFAVYGKRSSNSHCCNNICNICTNECD